MALVIAYPKPVIFTKGTIILLAGIAVICLPKDKKDVRLEVWSAMGQMRVADQVLNPLIGNFGPAPSYQVV
ncbi:hypothetical protein TNCV_4090051 [Trichonephila clavipes]|uniref:Uncharacterized protein n=1 Tax=Trichonephila clavipes TaxID=2585209 RepID=A0A8X6SH62_TRICX|nr:hypothetical protein TNCV_4090051 [Trichonephila clavipes]